MFLPGLRRNEQWVYHKAMEGLDSNRKDLDLTDKGDIVQNGRFNDEVGSVTKRKPVAYYNSSVESAKIDSIYRYYNQSSGTAYVITSTGSTIRSATAGTFSTIYTMSGSGRKFTAVTYKDLCILSNGSDNILQTDGTVAWELGACKVALTSDGGQMDATAAYYYAIVFNTSADGSGTDMVNGAVSNTVTTTSAKKQLALSYIPLGPTGTASRKIYRVKGGASTLEWVHVLGNNTATTWTDAAADAGTISSSADGGSGEVDMACSAAHGLQVGDRVTIAGTTDYNGSFTVVGVADTTHFSITDTWVSNQSGTFEIGETMGAVTDDMPLGKYLHIDQERLFVACDTVAGRGSYIYYSDQYLPHSIQTDTVDLTTTLPAGYYERFAPDDGDIITGLVNFLGINYVFKQNSIRPWYVKGTPDTWEVGSVISTIGSPAARSIQVTPLGIIYLGWDHFYSFNGQQSTPVIDDINIYETILDSRRYETVGFFWNNLYLVAYTDKNDANGYHDRALIYDLLRKQASTDKGGPLASGYMNVGCFTAFKGSTEWGQLYAGDSVLGWVYQYDREQNFNALTTKSGIDLGTHTNTMAVGEDNNPLISKFVYDNMETYTNNSLAQAGWVTSQTTASKKVPPDLGTGTDGAKSVSADETLSSGTYNYTSVTVASAKTLTISSSVVMKVLGVVTATGTISITATGSLTIYAQSVVVGAAGAISAIRGGSVVLKANTITNGGTIDQEIVSGFSGDSIVKDGDFSTSHYIVGQSGSMTDSYSFDSAYITKIKHRYAATLAHYDGGGEINNYCQLYYSSAWNTIHSQSRTTNGSTDSGTVTTITGWSAVTGAKLYSTISAYDTDTASATHYELQVFAEPTLYYINATGITGTSGSTTDFVNALECFSEGTTVNEGTYALKIVCPAGADTLDQYFTKTVTAIDLSSTVNDKILVDVYALRAGTRFQLGIGEAAATDNLVNVPVTASNTWETVSLDFSGVADASKNAIIKFGIKFTDTDSGNIVYIDNIRSGLYATATYTSPTFDINANTMGKMYWNENLAVSGSTTYGDVVISTRSGAYLDAAGTAPSDTNGGSTKAWHGTTCTDPTGSTIASTAARYFQFKITFTSTDTTGIYFPYVYKSDGYLTKFTYYKVSATAETAVEFRFRTGWHNFDLPADDKIYKKIVSVHNAPTVTGTFNLILEADKADTQTYTFSGINLATYPYRFLSNLPDTMYGKELRLEWYNNDANELVIQQYGVSVEDMPLI